MDILQSTRDYEKWMGEHTDVVAADLRYKHVQMKASLFAFLRGTFYRWVQLWNEHCPKLNRVPQVLGVGDLHVENFGTWRDPEGRLIWGVNDFDEACDIPYTNDLVRLATSAHVAIRNEHLTIRRREACDLILGGYSETLRKGGKPFVLDEEHAFLRSIALTELRDPVHFWAKMRTLPKFKDKLNPDQRYALELLLPDPVSNYKVVTRRAGFGSLGRVRLVAIAEYRGGPVAREIKAFLPSAWNMQKSLYTEIIGRSIRAADPFVRISGEWIVRRLAPDCSRIELNTLPRKRDEARLLHAMGCETANIHLGDPEATKRILRDLERRPSGWLHDAGKMMTKVLTEDWKAFAQAR
jgi:hypothetical protein